ncbi:MAG TPA: hypothetical protein VFH14_15135 [Gemmatimonadaceae bacterium]|nr:hypothetical protein [Gemmatimonadaceae bacterium]
MDAIGDDAARLHVELEVHLRLERADAIREGREQIGGAAALVAIALDLGLDARGEVEAEVGVLSENPSAAARIRLRTRNED